MGEEIESESKIFGSHHADLVDEFIDDVPEPLVGQIHIDWFVCVCDVDIVCMCVCACVRACVCTYSE